MCPSEIERCFLMRLMAATYLSFMLVYFCTQWAAHRQSWSHAFGLGSRKWSRWIFLACTSTHSVKASHVLTFSPNHEPQYLYIHRYPCLLLGDQRWFWYRVSPIRPCKYVSIIKHWYLEIILKCLLISQEVATTCWIFDLFLSANRCQIQIICTKSCGCGMLLNYMNKIGILSTSSSFLRIHLHRCYYKCIYPLRYAWRWIFCVQGACLALMFVNVSSLQNFRSMVPALDLPEEEARRVIETIASSGTFWYASILVQFSSEWSCFSLHTLSYFFT